jgi:hypothetical protein
MKQDNKIRGIVSDIQAVNSRANAFVKFQDQFAKDTRMIQNQVELLGKRLDGEDPDWLGGRIDKLQLQMDTDLRKLKHEYEATRLELVATDNYLADY